MVEGGALHVIVALIAAAAAFGMWADGTKWGGWLSGPVWTVLAAAALANVGLLPHRSPLYENIVDFLVPVAVVLFLLKADIRRIVRETGRTLTAYLIGAATSVIGIFVAVLLFALGPDEPQVAGIMAANLIGGTVNVVAVADAVGFNDPTRYAALLSGGAAAAVLYLAAVGALASSPLAARLLPGRNHKPDDEHQEVPSSVERSALTAVGLMTPLLVALVTVALSRLAAVLSGQPGLTIVFATLVALAMANVLPSRMGRLRGDVELGTIAMFAFFATIGAAVDVFQLLGAAALLAAFTLMAAVVHLGLLVGAAMLLKLRLSEALVASIAGIMGPATAAAFAGGRGWRDLVTPGVMTGVLGFAIATLIGLVVERAVSM